MLQLEHILPFADKDVPAVIRNLRRNPLFRMGFKQALKQYSSGLPVRKTVKDIFRSYDTESVQKSCFPIVHTTVNLMTAYNGQPRSLTIKGIENIDKNKGTILLSNHRDILSDPFITIDTLVTNNYKMPHCVFGNNLDKFHLGTILRLNNSIIYERNFPKNEMRKVNEQFSEVIKSITDNNNIVWIAQNEGRTKTGQDVTNKRTIFLLSMAYQGKYEIMLDEVNIIPMTIAYEYEPVDWLKADEMHIKTTRGSYTKGKFEDLNSTLKGLKMEKGAIVVAFGKPIEPIYSKPQDIADAIDKSMHTNYHLHPTNIHAYNIINGIKSSNPEFDERLERFCKNNEHRKKYILDMYANPVKNKLKKKSL